MPGFSIGKNATGGIPSMATWGFTHLEALLATSAQQSYNLGTLPFPLSETYRADQRAAES
jgi:hypothetical protein